MVTYQTAKGKILISIDSKAYIAPKLDDHVSHIRLKFVEMFRAFKKKKKIERKERTKWKHWKKLKKEKKTKVVSIF